MAVKKLKTLQFAGSEDSYELTPDWKNVQNTPELLKLSVEDDDAGNVAFTQTVVPTTNE